MNYQIRADLCTRKVYYYKCYMLFYSSEWVYSIQVSGYIDRYSIDYNLKRNLVHAYTTMLNVQPNKLYAQPNIASLSQYGEQ